MKQSLSFIEVERHDEHLNLAFVNYFKTCTEFFRGEWGILWGRLINTPMGSYLLHHMFDRLSGSTD